MASTLLAVETDLVPRTYVVDPPLSDDALERLCERNGDVRIERTSEGAIRVNPPTGLLTGHGNSEIIRQLGNWWDSHHRGRVFDSSTGFFLADGSLLSPDAAYALPEQLAGLTKAELARMPHLCPAFVLELLSPTDRLADAEKKMECWIANGARLGWLVDPYRQCVVAYLPGLVILVNDSAHVRGSGPIEGFVLDAGKVWLCYEV
jgi:Uma2 family endonuclease